METINEIEKIVDEFLLNKSFITREEFIKQSNNLKKTIIYEVEHFDLNKDYLEIYNAFRNAINEKYILNFTDILDITIKCIIHEIYLSFDSYDDINVNFEPIKNAPSSKRKHFLVAEEIVEKTIKSYYLNPDSNKKIIEYIDELLPYNYTKEKDIDLVVWYFLICIITIYKTT